MEDKEQQRRERAYKIWEDEGRVDGGHEDHLQRAEDQHEATEAEAAEITDTNQKVSEDFSKNNGKTRSSADLRPPSVASSD